jgi:hypothetical protein
MFQIDHTKRLLPRLKVIRDDFASGGLRFYFLNIFSTILFSRAKRDFDVKKAEYDTEVNTARAEAELAYDLQVQNSLNCFQQSCQ